MSNKPDKMKVPIEHSNRPFNSSKFAKIDTPSWLETYSQLNQQCNSSTFAMHLKILRPAVYVWLKKYIYYYEQEAKIF